MLRWLWKHLEPEPLVDRWYRAVAEDLIPSDSGWGWSYCGYELRQKLGVPEDHDWHPRYWAKGLHLVIHWDVADMHWSVRLSPQQWQGGAGAPDAPAWMIDWRYFTHRGAVNALAKSIKMLDQEFMAPADRAAMVTRLAQEGALAVATADRGDLALSREAS
jgi:hypothetical protein